MNVRILCLGILSFHDASGYEIKKNVEEGLFSHFIEASFGAIYPALTQMLQEGLVSVEAHEQSGKPDKKVYSITEAGQAKLAEALLVRPQRDRFRSEFLFQMLLMPHIPSAHLTAMYQDHLAQLRKELAGIEYCAPGAAATGAQFVNGYGQAVLTAAVKYLEESAPIVSSHNDGSENIVEYKAAAE